MFNPIYSSRADMNQEDSWVFRVVSELPVLGPLVSSCKIDILRNKILASRTVMESDANYNRFEKIERRSYSLTGSLIRSSLTTLFLCTCMVPSHAALFSAVHFGGIVLACLSFNECCKQIYTDEKVA